MDIDETQNIKNSDIVDYLKLPSIKLHCSMLAEDTIKKTIQDLKVKNHNMV